MANGTRQWYLMKGRVRFGTLTFERAENGWVFCRLDPTLAFDAVKDTFEEEVILLEQEPFDEARWRRAARKIEQMRLVLQPVDGTPALRQFVIHIDGDRAWFRPAPVAPIEEATR